MASVDEVLVVGAGPVGLTAACQLARLGVPVRVVDALPEPTTESRAVSIHARSMEMLAALGVLPQLEERARRIPALEFLDGRTGTVRARIEVTGAPTRHPYVLDIPQPDTEAVLADRANELGVTVERDVRVVALSQDDDGVDVTLRSPGVDERRAHVGWVVGADGGHSSIRELSGTKLQGGFHGQHFAMADVDLDTGWPPDAIRMFLDPEGLGILFPLIGDRARIMFLVDDPGRGAPDPTLEQIQALADARMGGDVRVRDPRWLTHFEVHHAQVPHYRLGRVLLAGDAAHIHSPAGAQGMNTGVQDAANLAWKLALVASGRAGDDLLDSYQDERHPVGAMVVRTTTALTEVGTATGPEAAIRDLALFLLGHLPPVAAAATTTLTETAIGYRHSPLAVHHGHHGHGTARAGDHAPDPDGLLDGDGRPVTLEDLLARPGLLLLTHCDDPAALEDLRGALGDLGAVLRIGTDLLDPDEVLRHAYGWRGDGMALVRPDGYLGLVAATADADVLRRYLVDALRTTPATTV